MKSLGTFCSRSSPTEEEEGNRPVVEGERRKRPSFSPSPVVLVGVALSTVVIHMWLARKDLLFLVRLSSGKIDVLLIK